MFKTTGQSVGGIFAGFSAALRGIKLFYGSPRYWKYAMAPMIISLLLYVAGFTAYFAWVQPQLNSLLPNPADYSEWLRWLIYALRWLVDVSAFILGFTVFLLTFTAVYFMISAPFFDNMTIAMEKHLYGFEFKPAFGRELFHYWLTSALGGAAIALKTLFWSVLLFPFTFLAPYVGIIIFIMVVGYLMARSFLLYSAEHRRVYGRKLKEALKGNRLTVTAFGAACYLMMFIPFAAIVLLPAAVAGGVILFNERIFKPEPPVK